MLRHRRGQALTEFALLLPFLLVFLFGIIDVGRMVYAYNSVSNAAREAGRTAIVNQTEATIQREGAPTSDSTWPPDRGACWLPTRRRSDDGSARDMCRSAVSGCDGRMPDADVVGCTAIVAVKWEWRAITPIIGDILGPLTLESTT